MGMVLITPTSIAHAGTSASIGTNGQVTFTAVTSLSLNGVFSATYDNYVVSIRSVHSTADYYLDAKLRASGTDASGSNYTYQNLVANSTTVSGARFTSQTSAVFGYTANTQRSGETIAIYGPYLAQPTAWRTVNVLGRDSGIIADFACTHSLSTAYDGFTISVSAGNVTGTLQVYGVRS
jgi:hypothetical protein